MRLTETKSSPYDFSFQITHTDAWTFFKNKTFGLSGKSRDTAFTRDYG